MPATEKLILKTCCPTINNALALSCSTFKETIRLEKQKIAFLFLFFSTASLSKCYFWFFIMNTPSHSVQHYLMEQSKKNCSTIFKAIDLTSSNQQFNPNLYIFFVEILMENSF